MMKTYLKRAFQLSDSGVKGLAKSIWSFFLYYVSFVPPMICVFLFADRLLNMIDLLRDFFKVITKQPAGNVFDVFP